jgi:hypothetical protein
MPPPGRAKHAINEHAINKHAITGHAIRTTVAYPYISTGDCDATKYKLCRVG